MPRKIVHTAPRIGVLALQGAFREHVEMLYSLGVEPREIRTPAQLLAVEGLIIPGGESTTIGKLASEYGLMEAIRRFAAEGKPIWGTCAGLILLARDVGREQPTLGLMDIKVERNAFGRQLDSFQKNIAISSINKDLGLDDVPFPAIFIRAPIIEQTGKGAVILSTLPDGRIVAARQGKLLVTSFHPELTQDSRIHRYFLHLLPRS